MKLIYQISILLILSGCNPIPIHYQCTEANFAVKTDYIVTKSFDTWGIFGEYCKDEIPREFSIIPSKGLNIDIRVRGEWIDLRAFFNNHSLAIIAPTIHRRPGLEYSYSIRVDSLESNILEIELSDHGKYKLEFTLSKCTCVTYDSV